MTQASELLARLRWPPIAIVLGLGCLLRLAVFWLYGPAVFNFYGGDSTRYLRLGFTGFEGLFGDPLWPAGYPAFLRATRSVTDWLPFTIALQHVFGIITAAVLYLTLEHIGAPRWAALVPAATVALNADQIFLEHGILTESLWTLLLAIGCGACAVAANDSARRHRWLLVAGAVIGLSALTRSVSLVLPVLLAGWALTLGRTARERVKAATAVLAPAVLVVGAYVLVATSSGGGYAGLFDNSGFSLYGRVAQFADCREFDPPPATDVLCVTTPPGQRAGTFWWAYNPASPVYTRFGLDIRDDVKQSQLRSFGRAAIVGQPGDYARTVVKDIVRYVHPRVGFLRPDSGTDADRMSFASLAPAAQGVGLQELAGQYREAFTGVGDGLPSETGRFLLGGYQRVVRVSGAWLALLLIVSIAGLMAGRGPARSAALMFLTSAMLLFAFPPLVSSYDVRYGVPPSSLLACSAALGVAALWSRRASFSPG